MSARRTVFAGGVALIGGALAFLGVFSYLAVRFHYPEVLDGRAADVLPALLATGTAGRAVWAIYGLLPLIFIPAGVGAFHALSRHSAAPMRVGERFAFLAAITMMLGLLRWPGIHWRLAQGWSSAGPGERVVLEGMWRNVTPAVSAVAAANNYLLPAWMIGFGVWLIVASRRAESD